MWLTPWILCLVLFKTGIANPHAKRLYDDLLSNYNRLIRPVENNTEKLTVHLGLKLSQLIDVDLKNQVMTTNIWLEQKWMDYKMKWNPADYGGVEMLYVPSQHIWLPDIVLFNNADGKYEVTLMTKARLNYTGEIEWKPPAIYKSSCKINVEWFPFDEQSCDMKFGSWTYDGYQVDLKHVDQVRGSNVVDVGIDLKEFYLSVEWDILAVPAFRNEEYYTSQAEQQEGLEDHEPNDDGSEYKGKLLCDITFFMTLRRKTLFYTVNLIIPCVGISFLTVLVFYLPSDSGEKVTLCISILLSLTVFFLLLAEIIPPTSLAVPLLGKYLLFTMILVSLSIMVTVGILNVHFRSPATHNMSPWVRKVFIHIMPKLLMIERPDYHAIYSSQPQSNDYIKNNTDTLMKPKVNGLNGLSNHNKDKWSRDHYDRDDVIDADVMSQRKIPNSYTTTLETTSFRRPSQLAETPGTSSNMRAALRGVEYIAQHIKNQDKDNEVIEDWKYVAMVLDRLFLWLFTATCLSGIVGILLRAPSLYDLRKPMDPWNHPNYDL